VDVPDRADDRLHKSRRHTRRKGFRKSLLETAAGDVLEYEEEPAVRLAIIKQRYDVGVSDARDRTRLTEPAPPGDRKSVGADGTRKNLHGDPTIQARLGCQVDNAHRTPAQLVVDFETWDPWQLLRARQHKREIGAATSQKLQTLLAFRAVLDMLLNREVSRCTERNGAE
jgi:hypothetical protein